MATRVLNAKRLRRKLQQMPRTARDKIETALVKSAQEINAAQRKFVPVDDGDLRKSIGWRWIERKSRLLGVRLFGSVGPVFWGTFQEFGTSIHPATPFFFPIYRAYRRRVRRRIGRAVNEAGRIAARS